MTYANKREFKELFSTALAVRDNIVDYGIGIYSDARVELTKQMHGSTILVDREKIAKNKNILEATSLLKEAQHFSGVNITTYLQRYFTSLMRIYHRVYKDCNSADDQKRLRKIFKVLSTTRSALMRMDYSVSELIVVTVRRPTATHNSRLTNYTDLYYFLSN